MTATLAQFRRLAPEILPSTDAQWATGLRHMWRFEGDSKDDFDGVSVDTSVTYPSGRIGQCLSLDGVSGHGVQTPVEGPMGAAVRTMSCWVYLPSTPAGNRTLLGYGSTTGLYQRWELAWYSGALQFMDGNSAATLGTPTIGRWTHCVISFDGVNIRTYRDGVLITTGVRPLNTAPGTTPMSFGLARSWASCAYLLDDVDIWDTQLTDTQVLALYQSQANDATVSLWLDITSKLVNPELFGLSADTAQVWLAAHHIVSRPSSGGGGGVVPIVPGAQSITVGPVSITYAADVAASLVAAGGFDRTVYGQRYEGLAAVARMCAASMLMGIGTIP